MKFGDKLRTLIEDKNITQKELATKLNIAPSTVSSYVQNAREPDFGTLKIIADFFQVTTDYLLGYKPSNSKIWCWPALYADRSITKGGMASRQ